MLYDDAGQRAATSTLMYSPVCSATIGMAASAEAAHRVRGQRGDPRSTTSTGTVGAEVARLPLFNPERKTA
jgi:hypothetical protein